MRWWETAGGPTAPLNLVGYFLHQKDGRLIVLNTNRNLQLLATELNKSCVLE